MLTTALACTRPPEGDAQRAPAVPATTTTSIASAAVTTAAPSPPPTPPSTKLLPDEEVGPLLARLSENPGDFPSENYVTNETSLLHVAKALRDPRLHGRAYVGVGPEQNYTYLGMLEPAVAYVVDIRRGNFLEHLVFRGCFEAGATRAEFLSALLARRAPPGSTDGGGFGPLDAAFRAAPAEAALRDGGVARTRALLDRLHVVRDKGDDAAIARIHEAFFTHGLAIKYTMIGSQRKYPSLGENFSMHEDDADATTFLASEERYARVRQLVVDNRVLPVVGDFGGTHALRAVGEDMRARGQKLGVFYTSNVEQYLLEGTKRTYGAFVESVTSMPRDDASRIVRVWFDQGHAHPAQQKGHRTTQLTVPIDAWLARQATKPARSYWDVVTQTEAP